MTTRTMDHYQVGGQAPSRPPLLCLCLLVVLIVAVGGVILSEHAAVKHGTDAMQIRHCLNRHGPYMEWQATADPNTLYRVCQLSDGRWGFQAVKKIGDELREKTAFVKGNGTWQTLTRYLSRFATPVVH